MGQRQYNPLMEKSLRIFESFEEAEAADAAEDAAMTPQQRLQIALDLRNRFYPDAIKQGLARVLRITELERS
jgi:hypothetical protein